MARVLLILLFITGGLTLYGQDRTYSFLNFTAKDGLPMDQVYESLQDSRGFIWFATAEGLSRFDGISFRNFFHRAGDPTSLPGNSIRYIQEVRPGFLFFLASGVPTQMDTKRYETSTPLPVRHKAYNFIGKAEPGLFLASAYDTTYILDKELRIIDSIVSPIPTGGKWMNVHWLENSSYIIDCNKSAFIYDRVSRRCTPLLFKPVLSGNDEGFLFQYFDQKNGHLYFSNFYEGLFQTDKQGNILKHWPRGPGPGTIRNGNIVFVMPMPDDELWISCEEAGIDILDMRSGAIRPINHENNDAHSLADNHATCIFRDAHQNYWIGTKSGVSKLHAVNRMIRAWKAGLDGIDPGSSFQSIGKGSDGAMYLTVFDQKHFYRIGKEKNAIKIADERSPRIWYSSIMGEELSFTGNSGSVGRFNVRTGKFTLSDLPGRFMPGSEVVTMNMKQRNGDEWFSGNKGGGLLRVGSNGKVHHYPPSPMGGPLPIGYYMFPQEDLHGDMWFGNIKYPQLLKWDHLSDKFREIDMKKISGLSERLPGITDIRTDQQAFIWVAYEGAGIYRLTSDGRSVGHYGIPDGLPTDIVFSLEFDDRGRLWAGTPKGLSCIDIPERKILNFNKNNGLPDDRFEGRCSFFDSTNGQMWIGSNSTLIRFDPDSLVGVQNDRLQVFIDQVSVNGRDFTSRIEKSLDLQPDEDNMAFQFAAPSVDRASDIEYSFRLEGADRNWSVPTHNRSAQYAHLDPGSYAFHLRARYAGATEWSEMEVPVGFTIATPWYLRWWAFSMLTLLLGFLIWSVSRMYYQRKAERERSLLEKKQAVEQERTRIATDMHDDFGASLSRIKFLSEKSLLDEGDVGQLHEDLRKITRYSTEMHDKMGEIVWALNNKYDSLADLVSFCRSYAAEYLQDKSIELEFSSEGPMDLRVSGELRRNLFLVMKESLNNCAKHSEARNVSVSFVMNGVLRMDIVDDGKGFERDRVRPYANGLENIAKRARQVGGTLEMDGTRGTRITLIVDPGHPTKGL